MAKKSLIFTVLFPFSFSIAQEHVKAEKISVKEEKVHVYPEEINKEKDIDLGSLLFKNIPEINIGRKGVFITDIFLYGFGREKVNVLFDDSRIYGACPSGMDLPPFFTRSYDIQGIQIINGIEDIENQGSFGGRINIMTKKPQGKTGFRLNTNKGSYGLNSTGFDFNLNNTLFSFISEYAKPYRTGEGKKITEYPTGMFAYQNKYKNKKAFDLKQTSFKTQIEKLYFEGYYMNANSILYPYLLMDSTKDESFRFYINYKPVKSIDLKTYYSYMKHDMSDRYRKSAIDWTNGVKSTRGYMMRTLAVSRVYGVKITGMLSSIKAGVEFYKRYWNADNVLMMIKNDGMIPGVNMFNAGFFIKGKEDVNKNLSFLYGVRIDHTNSKADLNAFKDNKNLYMLYYGKNKFYAEKNYFSGFVSLITKISSKLAAKITLGQQTRFPNPQELFIALKRPPSKPDWVGNPWLKPEKNREISIEADTNIKYSKIKIRAFYSDLKDYIYLTKLTSPKKALSYENIDAYMYGISLNTFLLINEYLYSNIGISYQRGRKKSDSIDKDLAEIPPAKVFLKLVYEKDSYSLKLEDIYSFSQEKVDSFLNEQPTDSWNVVNVSGTYRANNLEFTVGIDNLFDKFYYSHLSYLRNPFMTGTKVPEPGRFLYARVSLTF